jgi:hypothetical protein
VRKATNDPVLMWLLAGAVAEARDTPLKELSHRLGSRMSISDGGGSIATALCAF